jgi:hypothetical protein
MRVILRMRRKNLLDGITEELSARTRGRLPPTSRKENGPRRQNTNGDGCCGLVGFACADGLPGQMFPHLHRQHAVLPSDVSDDDQGLSGTISRATRGIQTT